MDEPTLDLVRPTLTLFYEALAGIPVALVPRSNEHDRRDTRTTIRLPDHLHDVAAPARAWYRIAVAHRAIHEQAGTYAFSFERPGALFARRHRPARAALALLPREADLDLFFRLFALRPLAVEVFTLLEDVRIEAVLSRTLPGLRRDLEQVWAAERVVRPALAGLAPRVALLEVLTRLSLGERSALRLPASLVETARVLATLVATLEGAAATVEDTAEATLRAYAGVVRLPALAADASLTELDPRVPPPTLPEWPMTWPEAARPRLEGDDILDAAAAPVGYRDLLGWRHAGHPAPSPLDQEALYRILPGAAEGEPTPMAAVVRADQGEEPAAVLLGPLPHAPHDLPPDGPVLAAGTLGRTGTAEWLYPEWDHVRGERRDRWCRVREERLPAGPSTRFFRETVRTYAALVPELRRGLERLAPRALRRVRRLRDGDEIDLDAAIEAFADLRAGVTPGDRVYTALERDRRDVATLFLFDVSSSTAERVGTVADQPPSGRAYHRIIDVEREAIALLMAALESVGDAFGVYAFSGTGRADVRLYVLKELQERLSDAVTSRLDAVRPVHTTRMGPAIRHATARLGRSDARTKLLVLISDGRPFDLDYGQEYGEGAETDYAIHDTRAALDEARAAGTLPFVLTVDPSGGDYLRELSGGLDYEVLTDTLSLPLRLLALYRRLVA